MRLFKKKLKIGRRVATINHDFKEGRDEFMIGKIVAIRKHDEVVYAVRFDNGQIDIFDSRQLYTEWSEE